MARLLCRVPVAQHDHDSVHCSAFVMRLTTPTSDTPGQALQNRSIATSHLQNIPGRPSTVTGANILVFGVATGRIEGCTNHRETANQGHALIHVRLSSSKIQEARPAASDIFAPASVLWGADCTAPCSLGNESRCGRVHAGYCSGTLHPAPRALAAEVSAELRCVVLKALAPNPAESLPNGRATNKKKKKFWRSLGAGRPARPNGTSPPGALGVKLRQGFAPADALKNLREAEETSERQRQSSIRKELQAAGWPRRETSGSPRPRPSRPAAETPARRGGQRECRRARGAVSRIRRCAAALALICGTGPV